jgi:hypothetical protein
MVINENMKAMIACWSGLNWYIISCLVYERK